MEDAVARPLFYLTPELNKERPDPRRSDIVAAFKELAEGNFLFRHRLGAFPDIDPARRTALADEGQSGGIIEAQSPRAAILCCSDHRAAPEFIFNQGLGRLFVVREAGNRLDAHSEGSLEYAVTKLKTPLIVILGHTGCGAVNAAVKHFAPAEPGELKPVLRGNLLTLVEDFGEAYAAVAGSGVKGEDLGNLLSTASMQQTYDRIVANQEVVARGQSIAVVRAIYDVENGHVNWIDEVQG